MVMHLLASRQHVGILLLWGGIVAVGWFAYAPALSGAFLLDDFTSLAGLASVNDTATALHFALSGTAGPVGRPLALATFLPHAAWWEQSAAPFLRVNILIHLLNACVLSWVLYRLSTFSFSRAAHPTFVAIAAASLWLFMPLLASASLMVVQRMATLSALLVLLGIAGYLLARQAIVRRPGRALAGMSVSLIGGTLLAVLAKENGALLPTYVLVIEATLLRRPEKLNKVRWRAWQATFLLLPTALIVGYLLWRFPYSEAVILKRGFTGWERLLTESRILWQYLFNAFVPQPGKFGPFHDGYAVARTILDPATFLAVFAWITTAGLAVMWRRRFPLFSFAILWYLGGHLLESTVIPLNLYFEHRNYLPIIGPIYALCASAARAKTNYRWLVNFGVSGYILVNALVLFSFTSLWGDPAAAIRHWTQKFPESMYANTAAVGYQLAEEGPQRASESLANLVAERPEVGYLKLQELRLSCIINPQKDHGDMVSEINPLLKQVDFSYTALTMLSQLTDQFDCKGVDAEAVRHLALSLNRNPKYNSDSLYNQLHHQLLALLSQREGQSGAAIQHFEKAIDYEPSPDLNMMMVLTHIARQDIAAAQSFIEEARANAPWHPMRRYVWMKKLDELSRLVEQSRLRFESGPAMGVGAES